ncbi:MAG TPA: hypothetical protein VMY37_06385 [Thermoguttaceae bacterium]|nr:hypothetical protein [Thermoguttaceae bacterium]
MRPIREVLRERTVEWMAIPGVVGTAVGEAEGRPCIKVLVARRTGELAARFPADVEGHRVVVEETGDFRAL